MIAYNSKEHAPLLIKWWAELQGSDDFGQVVHSSIQDVGAFVCYFQHTTELLFEADAQGLWFAAAATRFFDGALWDVWIRPDKRHTSSALKAIELSYGLALEKYPSLFGLTQRRELHATHLKLGYEYAGRLMNNMDGKTQLVYQLTRAGWANRKDKARALRIKKRSEREALRMHPEMNGAVH